MRVMDAAKRVKAAAMSTARTRRVTMLPESPQSARSKVSEHAADGFALVGQRCKTHLASPERE